MPLRASKEKITAKGTEITVLSHGTNDDFICLTDIARYKNSLEPKNVVANWLRLRNTIEYLGIWEQLHNPAFKGIEFDAFLHEAGANAFTLSPQNIDKSTRVIERITPQSADKIEFNGSHWHACLLRPLESGAIVTITAQENLTLTVAPKE